MDTGLPLGERLLQWIKLAEFDLNFVEQIYDREQIAGSDNLQEVAATV